MSSKYPLAFSPIQVGQLQLDHRIVVPPHGGGASGITGSTAEFEYLSALWLAKLDGGMQWLGMAPSHLRNPLPAGFEPTGVGAHGPGHFRHPLYPERMGELASRIHARGGFLSCQMVIQGGMPVAPSHTTSGYLDHTIPHALDADEVRWLIDEFAESAAIALSAGVDAIEIHANHDDVVQWFLSPRTNQRTDSYGGSFENRRRFLREIVEAIRDRAPGPFTFGLRLCMDERIEGGFQLDECMATMAAFTAERTVDYFSLDIGSNWGYPSYVPPGWHQDHEWAPMCGEAKAATDLPVVYGGRVTTIAQAELILTEGWADAVGMVRAAMADQEIVAKTQRGEEHTIRPCIGLNDCIHRKQVDGLTYACGVNPTYARESEPPPPPAKASKRVLVIGGGPAGTELAGLCAERGHRVELWERQPHLGGLLSVATLARGNWKYRDWIAYQAARLERSGVVVRLGCEATPDDVLAAGADVVAVATGALPRRPSYPGAALPHVVTAAQALRGEIPLGHRIVVVSEDDGPAPLSVSDHLAGLGHHITLVYQGPSPSPGVGKYSIGTMLSRLGEAGTTFVPMMRATAFEPGRVHLIGTYGGAPRTLEDVDNVVLICGSIPQSGLYEALKHRHPYVRLLGDAFAPRRVVFATRQAWALAAAIDALE